MTLMRDKLKMPSRRSWLSYAIDNNTRALLSLESQQAEIDKSHLGHPEPRRIRDKDHLRFVAKQPCLICGRSPADTHHLRFAQRRAFGRKVSDEFTVPLCRSHHREVHRRGDEAAWWQEGGIDPATSARALWLQMHPLPKRRETTSSRSGAAIGPANEQPLSAGGPTKTNPR
jgi:hypothetical protein